MMTRSHSTSTTCVCVCVCVCLVVVVTPLSGLCHRHPPQTIISSFEISQFFRRFVYSCLICFSFRFLILREVSYLLLLLDLVVAL